MLKEVSVRTPGSLSSNHQRHDSARMAAWIILVWRDLGRYIFAPYSQIWVCLWNEPVKWAWTSMEHSKCTVTVSSKIVLYYFGIYISWLYDSIKFLWFVTGKLKRHGFGGVFLKLEAVTLLMDVICLVQKGNFLGLFSCIGALSLPKPWSCGPSPLYMNTVFARES